jgi:hypothetical protein
LAFARQFESQDVQPSGKIANENRRRSTLSKGALLGKLFCKLALLKRHSWIECFEPCA